MSQTPWKMIGACRPGVSHVGSGLPCQDYASGRQKDGMIVAVLADGLGSLPRSEHASKAAVEFVEGWLSRNRFRLGGSETAVLLQTELLSGTAEAIKNKAGLAADMDCNLAFLVLDYSVGHAVCGHLGDCAVCILDDHPRALTTKSSLANGTKTVLSARPEDLRVEVLPLTPQLKGFILTSDGLEGVIYRKRSGMICKRAEDYFNIAAVENIESGDQRLNRQLDVLQQKWGNIYDDDISIVVVSCGEPIKLPADPMWKCICGTRNSLGTSYCVECGTDVLKVYRKELKKYGNLDELVMRLNADPAEEERALNRSRNGSKESDEGISVEISTDSKMELPELSEPEVPAKQEPQVREPASQNVRHARTQPGQRKENQRNRDNQNIFLRKTSVDQPNLRKESEETPAQQESENAIIPPKKSLWKRLFPKLLSALGCMLAGAMVAVLVMYLCLPGGFHGSGDASSPSTKPELENGFCMVWQNGNYWIGEYEDGEKTGQMLKVSFPLIFDEDGKFDIEWVDFGSEMEPPPAATRPPEMQTSAPSEYVGDVTGNRYRVLEDIHRYRLDPSVDSDLIGKLTEGQIVTVIDGPVRYDGKDWVKIEELNGWIDFSLLSAVRH